MAGQDSVEEKRRREREAAARRLLEQMQGNNNDPPGANDPPDFLDVVQIDDEEEDDGLRSYIADQEAAERYNRRQKQKKYGVETSIYQGISYVKRSPILDLIKINDFYIDYDKELVENTLTSINNIKIQLEYLKDLEYINGSLYSLTFDYIADNIKKVNRSNRIKVVIPSNNNESTLTQIFLYTVSEIKNAKKLLLNYNISLNIGENEPFTKKIYVYEVDKNNAIVGEAIMTFGNERFNINLDPLI